MQKIKVLLITSERVLAPETKVIGDRLTWPLTASETEGLVELLTAANIAFDIKYAERLNAQDIMCNATYGYSTIIIATPSKYLDAEAVRSLEQASHARGISLIASGNRIDERMQAWFGIARIHGKRNCWGCHIIVDKQKVKDSQITEMIRVGNGWTIELDHYGLRRHPIRYMKKHLKKLLQQVHSYTQVSGLPQTEVLATIANTDNAAVTKYRYGKAINYYIALEPDFYLNRFTAMHRIVREMIHQNSGFGMASIDLENSMILRMDDPGSCERAYLQGYDTRILNTDDWQHVYDTLTAFNGKLSVMYVPLWVDDANVNNGALFIRGEQIRKRKKAATYLSKDVVFVKEDCQGAKKTYDYTTEFEVLKKQNRSGVIDIESHGLTHVDVDLNRWAEAPDRYTNLNWYHEFRHVNRNTDIDKEVQAAFLSKSTELIQELFGIVPSSVTPSGHEQSLNSEEVAHAHGFHIFSSECNSLKKNGIVVRNDKMRSVFFENTAPSSVFAESGYPVVGVFHDFDIVTRGKDWLRQTLEAWREKGIRKFISLRELAAYLHASLEIICEATRMSISVDITQTGIMKPDSEERFFSEHPMDLKIDIPAGVQIKRVQVNEKDYDAYRYDAQEHRIRISLPKFGNALKQQIIVEYGRERSFNMKQAAAISRGNIGGEAAREKERGKIVSQSVFYSFALYLRMFFRLLSGFVVARILGPELYGLRNAFSLALEYDLYGNLGTFDALSREVPIAHGTNDHLRAQQIEQTVFGANIIYSGIAAVLLLGAALYLRIMNYQAVYVDFVLFLGLLLITNKLKYFYEAKLPVDKEVLLLSQAEMFHGFASAMLCVLFVLWWGFRGLLLGLLCADLCCLWFIIGSTKNVPKINVSMPLLWELIKIGFPMMIVLLLLMMLSSIDRVIILAMISQEALGYYAIAAVATGIIVSIPTAINDVIAPRLMEQFGKTRDVTDIRKFLIDPTVVTAYIVPLILAALFFGIHLPVKYFLTQYTNSIVVVQILSVGLFFFAISRMAIAFCYALNKQLTIIAILLPPVVLNIALNIILINAGFGITGVAVGTSISYCVFTTSMFLYSLRQVNATHAEYAQFFMLVYAPFVWFLILLLGINQWVTIPAAGLWSDVAMSIMKYILFALCFSIMFMFVKNNKAFVKLRKHIPVFNTAGKNTKRKM